MLNLVGYFDFMCFSLAQPLRRSPFNINGDGTRLRQRLTLLLLCTFKNFNNHQPILFFVCHFKLMQISTECSVLKKVEIIFFLGSKKLKKCTNNIYHHDVPNYANFEG